MRAPAPFVSFLVLLAVIAAAVAWWFAVSSGVIAPDAVRRWLAGVRGDPWAPVIVLATFLVAGVVAFPIHAVVLATAAVFGPWLGFAYSAIGAFTGTLAPYFAGGWLGKETVARLLGPTSQRVIDEVRRRGLLVVVGFRLVPVAPGTVVNLALGASGIRPADFLVGSAVGMIPGLLLVSIIGDRIGAVLADPTSGEIGLLALCVVAYSALIFGAHAFMTRRRRQGR